MSGGHTGCVPPLMSSGNNPKKEFSTDIRKCVRQRFYTLFFVCSAWPADLGMSRQKEGASFDTPSIGNITSAVGDEVYSQLEV